MATPEELEGLASALLAEIEHLGKDVQALGGSIFEVRAAIEQMKDTLETDLADMESGYDDMLAEASSSLDTLFEMTQALSGSATETYATDIEAMLDRLTATRAEVAQTLEAASSAVESKLTEVSAGATALLEVVEAVRAQSADLAEHSAETLDQLREAVDAGTQAASARADDLRSAVEELDSAVETQQGELQAYVDSDLVPAVEGAIEEFSAGVRETTEQVLQGGIAASRDEALELFDNGVKTVVDEAVNELLRLMNELGDEILDKAEGPRAKTDAMREVIETLRGLIEPLIDRIGSVRGLAASVGVSV